MSISKKFNIELRYANQESAPGIHALAQELSSRGHSVTTKSTSSRIPNIDDITRSAANLKGIAETGVQILKDTIDSFVSKATDVKGSEKTDDRDAPKTDANGFDTIGPQGDQTEQNAKANESTDDNSAIVVLPQRCEMGCDANCPHRRNGTSRRLVAVETRCDRRSASGIPPLSRNSRLAIGTHLRRWLPGEQRPNPRFLAPRCAHAIQHQPESRAHRHRHGVGI